MIHCKELNKNFEDKTSMFKALKASKDEIIAIKKSAVKNSDGISLSILKNATTKSDDTSKLAFGDTISVVINTTNYLDSHGDVHLNGIWKKSASEQNGKTYHVINHELSLGNIVGYPKNVQIEVREMNWTDLGIAKQGNTEALIFHTTITDKTNDDAFKAYRDAEDVQHSIRMVYVKMALAVNAPDDEDLQEEYENWKQFYPVIMNSELADRTGYFWAVQEARIYKEGSTVLFGSNDMTPTLGINTFANQPHKSTMEQEPSKSMDVKAYLNGIRFFND